MQDSIFTKIIKGEIPCHKIYEDDTVFAFLDIEPDRRGHTLVVPKVQIEQYLDLDDATYQALWAAVKRIGLHLRETLGVERVAVKIIGVDVPHTHVHLVPFNSDEKPYRDDTSPSPAQEELAQLAEILRLT